MTNKRLEHLFIVRAWQEPSQSAPPGAWRFSITHVASGQHRYFANLSDLNRFMDHTMEDKPPTTDNGQPTTGD